MAELYLLNHLNDLLNINSNHNYEVDFFLSLDSLLR